MGVQSPSTLPTDATGISRVGVDRANQRTNLDLYQELIT